MERVWKGFGSIVCLDVVKITVVFVQVGCLTLKVDLPFANWLMNLQRWRVIQEDTLSFRYVTTMLTTLSDVCQSWMCN